MHVRVWFTHDPEVYYSGSGRTLAACVRRAKAACRALLLTRKRRPLRVLKTEDLDQPAGKLTMPTSPSEGNPDSVPPFRGTRFPVP